MTSFEKILCEINPIVDEEYVTAHGGKLRVNFSMILQELKNISSQSIKSTNN